MTLTSLSPPIAMATVLNVILFALIWRAHQVERRQGSAPWYLSAGLLAYALALGGILYFIWDRPLLAPLDHFAGALVGEAAVVVVVSTLAEAFIRTRGRPWRERAMPALFSVGAVALMAAVMFKG